jgi:hypothetical protein
MPEPTAAGSASADEPPIVSPFRCPWCQHLDTDHDPPPVGCTQCDCRHSATEPPSDSDPWLENSLFSPEPLLFERLRPRWACMDCGADTANEYFIITHELWADAVGGPGKICLACLERRLGRELTPEDFLPCPANDPTWRKTDTLRARLGPDVGLRTLTNNPGDQT